MRRRATMCGVFDVEAFVADCRASLDEAQPMLAAKEVLERAVAAPTEVEAALRVQSGVEVLHRSPDLTVVSVVVPVGLPATLPHDHRMWALVGIYGGQEDNRFFRRDGAGLEERGAQSVHVGETLSMGAETIHSICNPLTHSALAAIHVYGGDLIGVERSMWVAPDDREQPYDDAAVFGTPIRGG